MENKANYVAVGAFVLACILGIVITVLWLAGVQYSQEFAYYRTYFTGPVNGLGDGTNVRYNGIDVGRVTKVEFDPNDPQRVISLLQVKPNLNIRENATASLESEGLTGGTYVQISGGTKDAPLLVAKEGERYPVIKSKPSPLQQLFQSTPRLLAKLDKIADRLLVVLDEKNRKEFAQVLTNLRVVTGAVARRQDDIDKTLRNFGKASEELGPAVAEARASMKKFGNLSQSADDFVKGEGLAQFGQLLGEMRRLTASLTRLSDRLNRQPTSLLFGDRRKGYEPSKK